MATVALCANGFAVSECLRDEMGYSTYKEKISKLKLNYKYKFIGMHEYN